MKETLCQYLACPECAGELNLVAERREGTEIITGRLDCSGCGEGYPITDGVPRFARIDEEQLETAENFGAQWLEFDHLGEHHEKQFLDWIAPVTPEFIRGKVVLEGGCGKGRHTRLIAGWGAEAVIGVDLSRAVEAAYRNTRDLPNAHIIQADIFRLPLKPRFDYAFSVGVLHHLPRPAEGFASLVGRLGRGGAVSAWIYGLENNGWIVNFVNPIRERLTSRIPPRLLYYLSYLPTALLYVALKLVYAPLTGTRFAKYLFYGEYLGYISRFPFREVHNIVHDHLTAPVAFYISRAEFEEWFRSEGLRDVEIHWHNRNSWRGFARRPGEVANA
ncbi:MAG: methyltransferase domain-containing protein [Blastocatellales bacterium]